MLDVQNFFERAGDRRLVVDDQDARRAMGALVGSMRARSGRDRCLNQRGERQKKAKRTAAADLSLHDELPPEARHDTLADGQPEPRSDAYRLRREKRLENSTHDIRWDAVPGVDDFDAGPIGSLEPHHDSHFVVAEVPI